MKAALITGCSEGGIGHALALAFAKAGYHTFATARSVSKMGSLSTSPNITLLPLDVTSLASVKDVVNAVQASGHTLEVIVNNAGIATVLPFLDTDFEDGGMAKTTFETNVWGGARLVQAFQHVLIESKGTIVNVTSINTFMNPAWMAVYNASKAAQHSLNETLRIELEPFGVRVINVVTGAIDTIIMTKGAAAGVEFQLPSTSLYQAIFDKIKGRAEGLEYVPRTSTAEYANYVVSRVEQGTSGAVWKGSMSRIVWWCYFLIPFALEAVRYRDTGLPELRKVLGSAEEGAKKNA